MRNGHEIETGSAAARSRLTAWGRLGASLRSTNDLFDPHPMNKNGALTTARSANHLNDC